MSNSVFVSRALGLFLDCSLAVGDVSFVLLPSVSSCFFLSCFLVLFVLFFVFVCLFVCLGLNSGAVHNFLQAE